MSLSRKLIAALLVLVTAAAAPAFADPPHKRDRHHDRGHHAQAERSPKHKPGARHQVRHCPPGTVRQNRTCLRPDNRQKFKPAPHLRHDPRHGLRHAPPRPQVHRDQARRSHHDVRRPYQGPRVGQVVRQGRYPALKDPRHYRLETRRGWNYYRDGNYIYRVDSDTRRILAIMQIVNALSN